MTTTDQTPREIAILQEGIRQLRGQSEHMTKLWEQAKSAVKRVKDLHSSFPIYGECGHQHTETDEGVGNVTDVGLVCGDGYMYTACRHCCTDAEGKQTEACASEHDHSREICPTRTALDGEGLRSAATATSRVAQDVLAERKRQNDKWGELRYPDGTGRPGDKETARTLKATCKANTPAEDNWRDILAEEVGEAFAETDPKSLRTELIQVAATAQAWAEDIDRRATTT